jgi:hypothetical protein
LLPPSDLNDPDRNGREGSGKEIEIERASVRGDDGWEGKKGRKKGRKKLRRQLAGWFMIAD